MERLAVTHSFFEGSQTHFWFLLNANFDALSSIDLQFQCYSFEISFLKHIHFYLYIFVHIYTFLFSLIFSNTPLNAINMAVLVVPIPLNSAHLCSKKNKYVPRKCANGMKKITTANISKQIPRFWKVQIHQEWHQWLYQERFMLS